MFLRGPRALFLRGPPLVLACSRRLWRRPATLVVLAAAAALAVALYLLSSVGGASLAHHRARWRRHMTPSTATAAAIASGRALPMDYDPAALGVVPGSTGIVLTGPSGAVEPALLAVQVLRDLGCDLPVEFAFLEGELQERDLIVLRSANISHRNFFSERIESYQWTRRELKLGAAKLDAIVTSPFERVLYLDTDVILLRDPSFLFQTNAFRKFGALFWPDFPFTPRSNAIWTIMDVPYVLEREFEAGLVVLDKRRVWRGLRLAQYMCGEAKVFFQHIWGDKDTFRWGFKATGTPYFFVPDYLHSVGLLVSPTQPFGGATFAPASAYLHAYPPNVHAAEAGLGAAVDHPDAAAAPFPPLPPHEYVPPAARFCGQNMLQMGFDDDADWLRLPGRPAADADADAADAVPPQRPPPSATAAPPPPWPLFLHANGLK
ncbi:hypothetical protein HK405_012835, partial [Cladochytrium tenue]